MEPIFTVDASGAYGQGQEIYVVSDGKFGMYRIKFKSKGIVPEALNGSYTSAVAAKGAIERHLKYRNSVLAFKERKDKVREGKAKHALKQAALATATEV